MQMAAGTEHKLPSDCGLKMCLGKTGEQLVEVGFGGTISTLAWRYRLPKTTPARTHGNGYALIEKDLLAACHFVTHLPCTLYRPSSSSTTQQNFYTLLLPRQLYSSSIYIAPPEAHHSHLPASCTHFLNSPLSYCTHSFHLTHSSSFLLSNPLSYTAQPAASC
jgi:hypothetical protein